MSELDFGLDHLRIDEATAKLPMPWLSPDAELIVRPATDSNRSYQQALLKISGERHMRAVEVNARVDLEKAREMVEEDRKDDRRIYPGVVIVNWSGVKNKRGDDVPFSIDACAALLKQLPEWLMTKIRLFCVRPENFIRNELKMPNPLTIAGNSASA